MDDRWGRFVVLRTINMGKPNSTILQYLKKQGCPIDLPLDVLRQFQEFEKNLTSSLNSYDDRPEPVAYGMRSFTTVQMLGIALILSDDYPAARRCHDDIMAMFGKDSAFDDGVSLLAWILFNFPAKKSSQDTIATEILKRSPELSDELSPFIDAVTDSRLGLYEVKSDARQSCRLKELFTGNEITLNQTLGGIPKGRITVVRAINLKNTWLAFGDTCEFPVEYGQIVKGMVESKMSLYFPCFPNVAPRSSYETMMRLAGPYWFSILARDYRGDILNPDHHLSYYN